MVRCSLAREYLHHDHEAVAAVVIVFSWPGVLPGGARCAGAVSNVDVARTLVDLGGGAPPDDWDGDTLLPLMRSAGAPDAGSSAVAWKDETICEYYGHATNRLHRTLRAGRWKYCYYHQEPAELYDLVQDPDEFRNLAGSPELSGLDSSLRRRVLADWDPEEVERQVPRSQRARQAIVTATRRDAPAEPHPQGLPR